MVFKKGNIIGMKTRRPFKKGNTIGKETRFKEGHKHSEKVRKAISKAKKGKPSWNKGFKVLRLWECEIKTLSIEEFKKTLTKWGG